jgi:hypothetical protein
MSGRCSGTSSLSDDSSCSRGRHALQSGQVERGKRQFSTFSQGLARFLHDGFDRLDPFRELIEARVDGERFDRLAVL